MQTHIIVYPVLEDTKPEEELVVVYGLAETRGEAPKLLKTFKVLEDAKKYCEENGYEITLLEDFQNMRKSGCDNCRSKRVERVDEVYCFYYNKFVRKDFNFKCEGRKDYRKGE